MSTSTSFWDHPLEKLEEALSIRKQIAALQAKLSGLFGSEDSETPTPATQTRKPAKKGKRTMSPEARERIAAAQRARWAKQKGTVTSAPQTAKTPKTKGAPAVNATAASTVARKPKAKRNVSPEARAKMAAAARKRWAAVKAK